MKTTDTNKVAARMRADCAARRSPVRVTAAEIRAILDERDERDALLGLLRELAVCDDFWDGEELLLRVSQDLRSRLQALRKPQEGG